MLTSRQCHLGSPVREICTPGSAWGDEIKTPCSLGEAPARKAYTGARLRNGLTLSRLVSTIPNETSYKAARPFAGAGKWLTGFDLDKLTAGAAREFGHIGSETIQRVNAEHAAKRSQAKKPKLRWRVSKGAKRSLGWVPFKAAQLKLKGRCLRFSGKAFRVFEQDRLQGVQWKSGCFAQDAVGDWWLCVPVAYAVAQVPAPKAEVGIDLGLKTTAATSDGARLEGHPPQGAPGTLADAPL